MMTAELKGNSTVGLMHGRLHSDEKEQVMRDFSEGNIDVLVSTTVVEVGVNVPNATFMIIFDAERFGLPSYINYVDELVEASINRIVSY